MELTRYRSKSERDRDQMIALMVGRRLHKEFPVRECRAGKVRLSVRNLNRGSRLDASFDLRAGEIVGLTTWSASAGLKRPD